MNAFRRLSITARITIGSLIVAFLFSIVAVIGVRLVVATVQHAATVTLLRHDTAPFTETLEHHPEQALGTPGESQSIAIIDPSGDLKVSTMPRSLRPRIPELATALGEPTRVTTAKTSYLVYAATVKTPAGKWTVIAARNEDSNQLVLDRLSIALIVGAAVLVVCFSLASWVLARTALRPVNSMRRQADRLSAGHADALLPLGPAHDELFALATTLNSLIGQLRASADREKQMVSDASHELRTPLAVLQGELELAAQLDAGDADALLRDIHSSHGTVLRLSQLARNLLELSRIEATPVAGASHWRELTDELADAIDRARALAPADANDAELSIDFDYTPRDDADVAVALAPHEFGRILDNLLGNAVGVIGDANAARDLAPSGSVTAVLSRAPGFVRLTVSDSGPGMPDEFIPVALDRFTRVDASRGARSGGGRSGGGLGLAIVAALVSSAQGTITLANAVGGGLRVVVELPTT